jgi:hypothetical protein
VPVCALGGIDGERRVVFHATLEDGRELIARTVPEPGESEEAIVCVSLAFCALRRRRAAVGARTRRG